MKHAIPTDWDRETFCRFSICWPDSPLWRALLRGLVTEPARGFFWDEKTGSIRGVLADFRQTLDHNIELWEVIMACNDQGIAIALNAIAEALSKQDRSGSGVCCEQTIIDKNGGISGSIETGTGETIPIFGTQPPLSIEPGTFPAGYNDLQEYNLDKCQVANLIVDGAIGSLRGLGALGAFNYAGLAALIVLAITGAIVFPPAAIPIMGAALGFLAVEVTLLTLAANSLQEDRDEWVCTLYNAEGVEAAIAILSDLMDKLIETIGTTSLKGQIIKQILLLLFNSDTLNQLFSKTAHLTYPNADCSACEPGCQYLFDANLEGWQQVSGTRAISWSSVDDGVMKLDGRGAGGSNWSATKITASEVADCLGVAVDDLVLSRIRWEINYRTLNLSTSTLLQAYTIADSGDPVSDITNNIFEEYTTKVEEYPGDNRKLVEFQLYSGNPGEPEEEEFISYVRQVLVFYTP